MKQTSSFIIAAGENAGIKRTKMKTTTTILLFALIVCVSFTSYVFGRYQQRSYVLEHEADIAKEEPGTHKGTGTTLGYSFFKDAPGTKLTFRKRVMKPGSSIGYHLQKNDEIYYIASGTGTMQMNGETFPVKAGDAVLTYPGSSHGLIQTGSEDMVVMIVY